MREREGATFRKGGPLAHSMLCILGLITRARGNRVMASDREGTNDDVYGSLHPRDTED
jgi:hypothetical protein